MKCLYLVYCTASIDLSQRYHISGIKLSSIWHIVIIDIVQIKLLPCIVTTDLQFTIISAYSCHKSDLEFLQTHKIIIGLAQSYHGPALHYHRFRTMLLQVIHKYFTERRHINIELTWQVSLAYTVLYIIKHSTQYIVQQQII